MTYHGCARASVPQHALLIEIRKRAGRVVFCLERTVAFAAIYRPEDVRRVITVGIERFDSAESRHFRFDPSVEISGIVPFAPPRDIPEAEIDVELPRLQRIERKAVGVHTRANRANPDRRDPDL